MTRLIEVIQGPRRGWVAAGPEGHPVGIAWLDLSSGPTAKLELIVHPTDRRAGHGTRLFEAATEAARDAQYGVLVCQEVEVGSDSEAFLAARGLRPVLRLTYTRLDLDTVQLPTLEPPAGYRLAAWRGAPPDELLEAFTVARPAMDDMPMADMAYTPRPWTVERVRAVAQAVADRGDHLDTVAAIEVHSGSVAAFTEVVLPSDGSGDGQHYGTGVLPAHRGRGLASWLKVEAIQRVHAEFPGIAGLLADTADSNIAMRRINERLGYVSLHASLIHQLDLSTS